MNLRIALLAASVAALPMVASAQVVTGPYISAGAGTTYEQQESVASGNAKFNWGEIGQVSAGYGFGNGWRAELEGTYLNNQVNGATGAEFSGGREQKYGGFVNGLYDFDIGSTQLYPYVGVGAGYEDVHEDASVFNATQNTQYYASGNKGNFAVQAIVGAAFPISGVPGLSLTAEYRFQDVMGNRGYAETITDYTPAPVEEDPTVSLGSAYNHSLMIGLRYAFDVAPPPAPAPAPVVAPAPAPVAAPAPAPARTYLVFFDWDKADLTDKAKAIIADAAQASTQVQTTQIAVNGYTDLSGTAAYNQALSVRRAKAVAAELVRLGVPSSEIDIMGFGESNPLVPTAQGVREPQNRRVEIILK